MAQAFVCPVSYTLRAMKNWTQYYQHVLDDLHSPSEEFVNVLTHAIGLALAISGTAWLLLRIFMHSPDAFKIAGGLAFGLSLVMVYVSSTLYHAANRPRLRHILNILDHIAIYFLIAGTYTPFILLFMRTPPGYTVLIVLWCIAAAGLVYKIFAVKKHRLLSTLLYLAMGWAAVFIFQPMLKSVPLYIMAWIAAGGLCYTLGTVFYMAQKLRYHHAIWHLFVMGGSLCHYFGVLAAVSQG